MIGYRLLCGFSSASCVIAALMLIYQLISDRPDSEIPIVILTTGFVGTFASIAIKETNDRIRKLEEGT